MDWEAPKYSFARRAAEKAAARAKDEADLRSGAVAPVETARLNGGGVRNVRYVGPSIRIQRLAAS